MQNIIKHNIRTSMNERIQFFIKTYISHTLFSKGLMFLWCARDGWRRGQSAILTPSSFDYSSNSSSSWLGLLNCGSLRAASLQSASWFSRWHPISNWLKPSAPWLYYCLTFTWFRCSSAYLHRCIFWLTARSRVNILHLEVSFSYQDQRTQFSLLFPYG